MPTGIVATTNSQASRSYGVLIRRWRIEEINAPTMRTQSRQKKITSAAAVATYIATSASR